MARVTIASTRVSASGRAVQSCSKWRRHLPAATGYHDPVGDSPIGPWVESGQRGTHDGIRRVPELTIGRSILREIGSAVCVKLAASTA